MSTTTDVSRAPSRSAPGRPHQGRRLSLERIPGGVLVIISLAILVGAWQLVIAAGWISPFILPSPHDTAVAFWDLLKSLFTGGEVWTNTLITGQETLEGLVLAALIGALVGVLIAETVFGRKVVQPLMVALYAAPKVALAPLFVAWFGFGVAPKVVMAATIAFFPVMVDIAAGLAGVDEDQDKLFTMGRASAWQRFWKLKLPTALPFLFAGLKSAAVLSIIGAIVAEFMGGGKGLGVMVQTASTSFALDRVFALIILLSIIAFAIYLVVDLLERRIVHWRKGGFIPTES